MSGEQIALLAVPPSLTARQQAVMDAVTSAGHDGLSPSEAGAILHEIKEGRWAHPRGERCDYCGRDGVAVLKALRKKGLVRYRAKLKVWQAVALPTVRVAPQPDHEGDGPVPFNAFPAGF